ncbi:MAG: hypothetical protein KDJ52_33930, partial [Anaerolineae bacterium]|nr:hypothetical protein [Anaerolineae bacterium]
MTDQDANKKLLRIHKRRLQVLKEQKATFGINAPPHIDIEIEDLEAEIEKLQQGGTETFTPEASLPADLPPAPKKLN